MVSVAEVTLLFLAGSSGFAMPVDDVEEGYAGLRPCASSICLLLRPYIVHTDVPETEANRYIHKRQRKPRYYRCYFNPISCF
nr:allatostatin C-1 [Schistocerca gregaria]